MSLSAENMGKIAPVLAEIFIGIPLFVQLFAELCKNLNFSPHNIGGYWTKVHLIASDEH